MTKKHFLSKLHNALLLQYEKEEIAEIIADYEEMFEAAEEAGEKEEDLCIRFGTPEYIVNAMNDHNSRFLSRKGVRLLLTSVIILIGLFYILYLCRQLIGDQMIMYSMILLILIPIFVWRQFGGFGNLPYVTNAEVKKWNRGVFIAHLVLVFIGICIYLLMFYIRNHLFVEGRNSFIQYIGTEPAELGPAFSKMIWAFYLILFVSITIDLLLMIKKSDLFFPYICVVTGLLCSGLCLENMMAQLSDPAYFMYAAWKSALPFLFMIAFLLFREIYRKFRLK